MKRTEPIVAIDGPAGSGKSTVAKALAKRLGYRHVDSGALYRAVALHSLRSGIDTSSEAEVESILGQAKIEFRTIEGENHIFLNDEDVSDKIRTEKVSACASQVSAFGVVREALIDLQRTLGGTGASVLEGRDIGTVIFPDAEVKVFLTASLDERARRRTEDLRALGDSANEADVKKQVQSRDDSDMYRKIAPLKKAEDALELDTTGLSIDEVLEKLEELVVQKRNKWGRRC